MSSPYLEIKEFYKSRVWKVLGISSLRSSPDLELEKFSGSRVWGVIRISRLRSSPDLEVSRLRSSPHIEVKKFSRTRCWGISLGDLEMEEFSGFLHFLLSFKFYSFTLRFHILLPFPLEVFRLDLLVSLLLPLLLLLPLNLLHLPLQRRGRLRDKMC